VLWAGLVRKFDFKIRYVGEFNGVHAVELLARSLCFVSILSPIWLVFMVLLIRYIFFDTVSNERMRHVRGSKHTLTLPTYFQGIRTPSPNDLRPLTLEL